ncbi:MAG: hypothetical protein H6Q35_215 [Proteobacteria bacterium]|nr:hypothetical protein [Pseudomonadota bacterium]
MDYSISNAAYFIANCSKTDSIFGTTSLSIVVPLNKKVVYNHDRDFI